MMGKSEIDVTHMDKKITSAGSLDNDEIYARIFESIVDHRLSPGTHLKEDILCEVYGVGRTRIRAVLSRLSADCVIELLTNRGAFVCRPTSKEAREVFRARRLIECHLVRRAAESPNDKIRSVLHDHLVHEKAAREAGDQSMVIKRCGNFHQLLADNLQSPIMARFLHELIARSALIVAIYEEHQSDGCEWDEHSQLTELVLAGKADEAAQLMERHLSGIENRLYLGPRKEINNSLRDALMSE
jgi:DNA-binding GntR family transcriptional regulator